MWARAGSDWKSGYIGGNAAYMLYYTSNDGIQWENHKFILSMGPDDHADMATVVKQIKGLKMIDAAFSNATDPDPDPPELCLRL